ncbi:hypothetical protein MFIFM68171_00079 [Madurella fahalii]|uniref:Heterokaryon incompatibility domain-containing protein n=1 Tax=Madurella fahalii TaxID=1157608 RepID=A0ABQ0FWU0_9PEZI
MDETSVDVVIKLVEQNDETPYVAISHIWADGLGNLARNGIPRCQMLRMSQISRQILAPNAGACYFWLDTLCCPPDSMDQPNEQNLALDLMRDTYAKANTVLVLDRRLLRQDLPDAPGSGSTATVLLNIRTDILHRWYTIRKFKDLDESNRFYALYSSLASRTTSVLEDEPLCLAILLGFQVSAVADGKTHEGRMLKFWAMFDELPAEIMDHYDARMTVPGFRWAPQSFVSDEEDLFPYSNKMLRHGRWKPAARRTFSFDLDTIEPLEIENASTTPTREFTACSPKRSLDAEQIALIYHSVGHPEDWKTQRGEAPDITGTVASLQGVADDGTISVRWFGLFLLAPSIPQTMPTVASLEEEVLGSVLAAGGGASDMALLETSTMSLLAAVLNSCRTIKLGCWTD